MTADTERREALLHAADAARYAPSVHNTQPWRWVVRAATLELHAAVERQLAVQDPDAHMLLLSCGAALHDAQISLRAAGWEFGIDRPAATPLAVISLRDRAAPDPDAVRQLQQLPVRRTDRRTVADTPVAPGDLDRLVRVTERAGARLHVLERGQTIDLAVIVERAEKTQSADEGLQREIADWAGGDRAGGTGIPAANLPEALPQTTVAERDYGTSGTLATGGGHDNAAAYAVLYGEGDGATDWLRAGEALNALWLAATGLDVTVLPLSGPVEVPVTRHELERLIGGIGLPYLVVRLGRPQPGDGAPEPTPRLPIDQIVDVQD